MSCREEERVPLAVDVEALAHRLQDAADEVARVEQREGDQEQVETVAHVPAKKKKQDGKKTHVQICQKR